MDVQMQPHQASVLIILLPKECDQISELDLQMHNRCTADRWRGPTGQPALHRALAGKATKPAIQALGPGDIMSSTSQTVRQVRWGGTALPECQVQPYHADGELKSRQEEMVLQVRQTPV